MFHCRTRFGREVLDNDLLDVSVFPVQAGNQFKGLDTVIFCFADTHQQPCGKRYLQFTGICNTLYPLLRYLARTILMSLQMSSGLKHQPHTGI